MGGLIELIKGSGYIIGKKSLYLKKNIGPIDRAFRLTAGTAMVIIPLIYRWPPRMIALLAAIGGSTILEGITKY